MVIKMSVDFRTFGKIAPFVLAVKKPVLLRGSHGIGKSQVVEQIGSSLKKTVVMRRASQMTEGDLLGLPSIGENCTTWNPPDWFRQSMNEGVILFFDEIDRATQEVRQGLFELTDSRGLAGNKLHPDTLIFGAINGGKHGSQYQVHEMDPAELDRWTVFDIEPSVEDFLDYGKDKLHKITWDFINTNRDHLEHKGEFEPNKIYPSRRSWFRFDECLQQNSLNTGSRDEIKRNLAMFYELGCAFVGMEAAVAYRDFADKYEHQLSIDDIFNGNLEVFKDINVNDHLALIEKIAASGRLKEKLDKPVIENLAKYARTLPAEACMKLWKHFGCNNVHNAVEFHKLLSDYVVAVMTGKGQQK